MKHALNPFRKTVTRQNKRLPTRIPLLTLQMAVFNSFPTKQHKDALANLRSDLADLCYQCSFKERERL